MHVSSSGLALALANIILLFTCVGCAPDGSSARRTTTRGDKAPAPGDAFPSFAFPDDGGNLVSWATEDRAFEAVNERTQTPAFVVHVFQPDCGACRDEAAALVSLLREHPSLRVVGIAHRGDAAAVAAYERDLDVSFPLAIATGTDWARTWGRGDPTYIVDRRGRIAYMQMGFEPADALLWRSVASDLEAGRPASVSGSGRRMLKVGDKLPSIDLPDLADGRPLRLDSDSGRLVFRDTDGRERPYSASIGFFSRY